MDYSSQIFIEIIGLWILNRYYYPIKLMSVWSQLLLQERFRPTMQLLSLFHDYSLAIITIILAFVTGVSLFIVSNKLISDSPIVTIVEVVWTITPVIILTFLVIPSLQILYYIEENDPFLTFKVTGHQWYWSYELIDLQLEFDAYISPNPIKGEYRLLDVDHRIVIPTNKDIRSIITASDVLHCWSLPALGIKADAVPGRLNQLYFNIIRPSLVYGQCSEICGANHRFIPISLEAINLKIFLNWINNLN